MRPLSLKNLFERMIQRWGEMILVHAVAEKNTRSVVEDRLNSDSEFFSPV
jgi:hypothetical protein